MGVYPECVASASGVIKGKFQRASRAEEHFMMKMGISSQHSRVSNLSNFLTGSYCSTFYNKLFIQMKVVRVPFCNGLAMKVDAIGEGVLQNNNLVSSTIRHDFLDLSTIRSYNPIPNLAMNVNTAMKIIAIARRSYTSTKRTRNETGR
jgi:hypothetical protein